MFDLMDCIIRVPVVLLSLSVHEWAHGFVSYKLGDPTPKMQGRLTLNPLAHLDLWGTLLMILTRFGWAKPVQINPMYYRDRTKGMALTALAGPLSNFLMATVGTFFLVLCAFLGSGSALLFRVLLEFTLVNLSLMIFNLIPFPPLDGFKVAGLFIPKNIYYKVLQYEQYIMLLLMLLCVGNVFSGFIGNGVAVVFRWLLNGMSSLFEIFV